ncbi:hypothetical protein [Dyella japonica]|uniref:Uncharacterized protein n=1 Tax=Dyella japonica DSM 16301 TaxID=1440762 RepID=A0A0G9H853_9GAMM|nr:hypothetical protein [Dyella japonica]KLD65434.1 hypothetical protein Y882_02635 [Dyella japonica DSM 16301]
MSSKVELAAEELRSALEGVNKANEAWDHANQVLRETASALSRAQSAFDSARIKLLEAAGDTHAHDFLEP